jgi:hypothetical protein
MVLTEMSPLSDERVRAINENRNINQRRLLDFADDFSMAHVPAAVTPAPTF